MLFYSKKVLHHLAISHSFWAKITNLHILNWATTLRRQPIPIAYRDAGDHSDQCYHYPQVCEQIQSQFSYSAKVERATNQISGHGEPICWKVISRETSTTFLCRSHFTILPLYLFHHIIQFYVKRRPLKAFPHVPHHLKGFHLKSAECCCSICLILCDG